MVSQSSAANYKGLRIKCVEDPEATPAAGSAGRRACGVESLAGSDLGQASRTGGTFWCAATSPPSKAAALESGLAIDNFL